MRSSSCWSSQPSQTRPTCWSCATQRSASGSEWLQPLRVNEGTNKNPKSRVVGDTKLFSLSFHCSEELLGNHETVQKYYKYELAVPLRLLTFHSLEHHLARDVSTYTHTQWIDDLPEVLSMNSSDRLWPLPTCSSNRQGSKNLHPHFDFVLFTYNIKACFFLCNKENQTKVKPASYVLLITHESKLFHSGNGARPSCQSAHWKQFIWN